VRTQLGVHRWPRRAEGDADLSPAPLGAVTAAPASCPPCGRPRALDDRPKQFVRPAREGESYFGEPKVQSLWDAFAKDEDFGRPQREVSHLERDSVP